MSSWDTKAGLAQGQNPGPWSDWEGGCGFGQLSPVLGGEGSILFWLLARAHLGTSRVLSTNNSQPGFPGNLLCLELRVGEEHLYVHRALCGLLQVPDKTRLPILQSGMHPVGLIIAEVSSLFKVSCAGCNAGSPGESPFTKAVAPHLFQVCI